MSLRSIRNLDYVVPRRRSYGGGVPSGAAGVQPAFRVAPHEVETCHEELVRAGATIVEAPQSHDDGQRTLFFPDPEGNVLEIYADI